jgi:hypothetical protein
MVERPLPTCKCGGNMANASNLQMIPSVVKGSFRLSVWDSNSLKCFETEQNERN